MRYTDRDQKNRRQYRVDRRDHDLCAHDRGEAAIEIAESRGNFIAANGVEIVLYAVSAAVRIQASFDKEAPSRDDSQHAKNQHCRRTLGKISNVAQVMCFLPKHVHYSLPKTFKVIKR